MISIVVQKRRISMDIFTLLMWIGTAIFLIVSFIKNKSKTKQALNIATVASAAFGTITLIPAFIAFPLVGTLVNSGVGIVPAAAFLTTLTMVGIVTFPLEKREFGTRFALTRNILSFVFAIIISLTMGVILWGF